MSSTAKSNKRKASVTPDEFVQACHSNDTTAEALKEMLKEQPELANALAPYRRLFAPRSLLPPVNNKTALEASLRSPEKVKLLLENGAKTETKLENGNTVLIVACRGYRCLPVVVQLLLDHKADPNATGHEGTTALMGACAEGHVEIVRILIRGEANVNARSEFGRTALINTCRSFRGSTEIVRLLLENGANVNAEDDTEGLTPLMGACCNQNFETARLLIASAANVNAQNHDSCTALLGVCQEPDENSTALMRLLLENEADPNVQRGCGCTAFSATIGLASLEQINLLLDHGADINSGCQNDGKPVQRAIRARNWGLTLLLLERGARPERCLLLAVQMGAGRDVMQALIEKGGPINETNLHGDSALSQAACRRRDIQLVRFLLEQGGDVNSQGSDNGSVGRFSSTPWLRLVGHAHANVELAKLFLDHNARVDDCDSTGNTPLMLVAKLPILNLILEQDKANENVINATNHVGDTALMCHCNRLGPEHAEGGLDILQAIVKDKRVDKNIKNKAGVTALMVAVQRGRSDAVELLLSSGGIAVNQADPMGLTALHQAVLPSCLVKVPPPQMMGGYLRFMDGTASLLVDGNWKLKDETSHRENPTMCRFWFRRVFENGNRPPLSQLEQLSGSYSTGFSLSCPGCSIHSTEGEVQLTFALTNTNEDDGTRTYSVMGKGPGRPYGPISIEGTAVSTISDDGSTSVVLHLVKTYHPGNGSWGRSLKTLCDNIRRMAGGRPKHTMAVKTGYLAIVDALLTHGAGVNSRDSGGHTPLMIATRDHGKALDMALLLLSRGAAINAVNNERKPALFLANEEGALSMVNVLLRSGALTTLKHHQ